ncbi:MAG: Zn-ribbon domain-containing OB-fold protein [Dehalococcoidia bacterium]|nr:Zn-ribbon domain-containing OB-fold protein [Dehalococcoidia bacterium]
MEKQVQAINIPGSIEIGYEWSAGIAGSRFFQELRDNKRIMGTKCSKCGRVLVPPRIFCEECFVDADEWVEVSSKGELITFAETYLSTDGSLLQEPWIVGIVKLDGADGGLIHYIGEAKPEDLRIGMRMEAVFNERRNGNILDIKYFKPSKKP